MPIFFVKIDASKKRCRGFSLTLIREIKIHAYAKRQTSDSSKNFSEQKKADKNCPEQFVCIRLA